MFEQHNNKKGCFPEKQPFLLHDIKSQNIDNRW